MVKRLVVANNGVLNRCWKTRQSWNESNEQRQRGAGTWAPIASKEKGITQIINDLSNLL